MKYLPTLAEFRSLRDDMQVKRRAVALPLLREQYEALDAQIKVLQKRKGADKHRDQIIDNDLLPLLWKRQYLWGQLNIWGLCDE